MHITKKLWESKFYSILEDFKFTPGGRIMHGAGREDITTTLNNCYVVGINDGIERIKLLKPSKFNFIVEPNLEVDGFLAHEVSDIVPEAITGEKDAVDESGDPIYQGIDQSKIVPLLTASIQELIAKVESLENEIESLKGGS